MMAAQKIELLRFLIVGVSSNVINYGIYLFVYWMGIPLFAAAAAGYVAGLFCSYHFGRIWIFGNKFNISKSNVIRFLAGYAFGGLGMCGLIQALVGLSVMNHQASWFVGAVFAMINNFLGLKKLVFYKGTNK
jgi:putative flippase GtrA